VTRVLGIDGGAKGAFAAYDVVSKSILDIYDMPIFNMVINNKERKRIDAVGVYNLLAMEQMMGCELVMIEAVGGRPKQSASSAFVFGYGIGLIYMACVALKLPIETVPPQVWKKMMRMPGKKDVEGKAAKEKSGMIVNRADELLPGARELWRTARGALRVDRAEAACIAKYAGDHALRFDVRPVMATDTLLAYQLADTGA
jgi:hypothetical protein